MKTRKHVALILLAATSLSQGFANVEVDLEIEYPKIYPFVPYKSNDINERVEKITEDKNFVRNLKELTRLNNSQLSNSKKQPWGSTYWPSTKGTIADPYTSSGFNPLKLHREMDWKENYAKYKSRRKNVYPKIAAGEVTEKTLATLAPSEKYDILLGDFNFDFTSRVWKFSKDWGKSKSANFVDTVEWDKFVNLTTLKKEKISSADQANYKLVKKDYNMAVWEGICHGWATASTNEDRPKKSFDVQVALGTGSNKKLMNMKFYPEDIKALLSHYWGRSTIQDKVIMEGVRCRERKPLRDQWGRFYDTKNQLVFKDGKYIMEPKQACHGVHPAVWHLSMLNLIGKQKRSFIIERKVGQAVDNHPMSGYSIEYYNPKTGRIGNRLNAMMSVNEYGAGKDPFFRYRHADTKYIIGVKSNVNYVDWKYPKRKDADSSSDDPIEDKKMLYDLELDKDLNVIGGQWRTTKKGKPMMRNSLRAKNNQPDFFWVIPKDFRKFKYPAKKEDLFANNGDRWLDNNGLPMEQINIMKPLKKFFDIARGQKVEAPIWKLPTRRFTPAKAPYMDEDNGEQFLKAALQGPDFNFGYYENIQSHRYKYAQIGSYPDNTCEMIYENKQNENDPKNGKMIKVPCITKYNYPTPLYEILSKLLKLSRK